jgi:hypothetical protein
VQRLARVATGGDITALRRNIWHLGTPEDPWRPITRGAGAVRARCGRGAGDAALPASDPRSWDYQPAIRSWDYQHRANLTKRPSGAPLGIGQNATRFFLPWHALTVLATLALPGNLLVMAVLTALVLANRVTEGRRRLPIAAAYAAVAVVPALSTITSRRYRQFGHRLPADRSRRGSGLRDGHRTVAVTVSAAARRRLRRHQQRAGLPEERGQRSLPGGSELTERQAGDTLDVEYLLAGPAVG